jgi:CheY-like chemotaxis protein
VLDSAGRLIGRWRLNFRAAVPILLSGGFVTLRLVRDALASPASVPALEALVVDDESETREVLSEFCRTLGLVVTAAADGRSAITAVERAPARFRVILTDIWMTGADGFEVLKAVRQANPSAYVVMITGYATLDSALRAVREGAYDYLPKPFALGQIEVVVSRIRDRIALEDENRMLSRQVDGMREGAGGPRPSDLAWRLDAIEERLARIEEALRTR